MKIADNIIGKILGKPRGRGGRNDFDGDGVPNKKDCQPRNTMRQDVYGTIERKPYTYPITVKRKTKEELIKDFPDVKIIGE